MLTPYSIHSRSFFSLVLALVTSATMGCGQSEADDTSAHDETNDAAPSSTNPSTHDGSDSSTRGPETIHEICEVKVAAGLASIAATDRGLVIAARSSDGSELLVRRSVGSGCALTVVDEAPIAAAKLVDADDLGNVYVAPAPSTHRGVISSSLPGGFDTLDSTIMKVDRVGNVSRFAYAGRGIWGFGVAPGGDAIWMSSCGPTGIFSVTPSGLDLSIPSPDTLWQQTPSVLTSASTFWSVGTHTCYPPAPMAPSCGSALVRTTAEGSTALGTTLIDFGTGYEQGSLARCGSRVCGVFTSAVVIWDTEGRVVRTITMGDVSTSKSETIEQVTGNDHGVYLLVRGDHTARVVFMGAEKTAQ